MNPLAALTLTLLAASAALPASAAEPGRQGAASAEELATVDRELGRASGSGKGVPVLRDRFDDEVVAPMPGLAMPTSRAALLDHLSAETGASAKVAWSPSRAGISGDGTHGFTLGHVAVTMQDGASRPMKYLAYWVKRPVGWRIAAFKRVPRPAGDIRTEPFAAIAPDRTTSFPADERLRDADAASLDAAERAFSAEAQTIGLGAAFAKYGHADAVNMGRGADFTIGAHNIGREMGSAPTSPVQWAPDGVLVAPSGDLGLTWGNIRSNDPAQAGRTIPFFTVWRRAGRDAPWRYIAE